jgi:hypothetical protein
VTYEFETKEPPTLVVEVPAGHVEIETAGVERTTVEVEPAEDGHFGLLPLFVAVPAVLTLAMATRAFATFRSREEFSRLRQACPEVLE